jgi:hypothetical protein
MPKIGSDKVQSLFNPSLQGIRELLEVLLKAMSALNLHGEELTV